MTELLRTRYETRDGPRLAVCDHRCEKAWGVNGRRPSQNNAIRYDDDDDVVYLADQEVGEAPNDPGTYEGGQAKPHKPLSHNKWCIRECERCSIIEPGEIIRVWDMSHRLYNQPSKHAGAKTVWLTTDERFQP